MSFRAYPVSRLLLLLAVAALPVVLLLSSVRTFREFEEQKAVYLRHHVAMLAGRLETVPDPRILLEEEPNLIDLEVFDRNNSPPDLEPIWLGLELFRAGQVTEAGQRIFRAWVPFHSGGGMRVARIDLDAASADFLVVHARHNVIVASASSLALLALALYAAAAARRAARLEVRQLELEHLAHMGKMAAVLAHEIRNPLGSIKGFAQLIAEEAGAAVAPLVEPILSQTARLELLVNDLLLYGRPPSPNPRRARWQEILAPLEQHARRLIGGRRIRFEADSPPLEWETDPHLLEQALLNVVRNAVEAIPDGTDGEIRITVRSDGPGVSVAVRDNGNGIDEAARSRLFEPFYTTKAFGTGLGLSITRNLVRSLGGEFTLESAANGTKGATGTVALMRFPSAAVKELAAEPRGAGNG